jgi:archaellum component FlaC
MNKKEEKLAKAQASLAQKRAKNQEKLDKLMKAMSVYSSQTDQLRKEFLENDGKIDAKEQKRLESIDKRIAEVIAQVEKVRAKMNTLPVESTESSEDNKRTALLKEMKALNSYLKNMVMVYGISNTQQPLI